MTTLLVAFALALALSLILTPISRHLGIMTGALDQPDQRKIHATPTPRTGGLGIFLSFLLSLSVVPFLGTLVSDLIQFDRTILGFLFSGAIIFIVGFIDDFRPIRAPIKLLLQIAAASVAFYFGVKIQRFDFLGWDLFLFHNELFSYLVTIFWFLLFINAVNLIDGLDGLAGGVCLITSIIMIILLVFVNQYQLAIFFCVFAGSIAGFLPYNFRSAKVFMGDSGSYFLGYTLAGLAIIGSVKSQLGATLLMLLIAMGIPLFDVAFSPIRRFLLGKSIFQPDKKHIHHRLLSRGLSERKAVLVLYGATIVLCGAALLLVNIRSEQAGFLLTLLGIGAFFFLRGAGYFRALEYNWVQSWFRDLSDVTALSKNRRTFLDLQLSIHNSKDLQALWKNVCSGLEALDLDFAEIKVTHQLKFHQAWSRSGFLLEKELSHNKLLKLELPLQDKEQIVFGTLWLIKDLSRSPINHYTLIGIEHLRRSINRCLYELHEEALT